VGRVFSTTALGLYFAALYLRTRTLWVPILVHMLVNLSSYIFNAIVSNDVLEQMAQAPENITGNIMNRLLLTVVFLIAGLILLKKVKPNEVIDEK
jgi:membrane protease YdiL (CAAX protease family)